MPTVAKTSSTISKLGDLSTFDVSSAAIPVDTADSSGSLPALSVTTVDATQPEYLVGESLSLSSPSIGSYVGEIISHSKPKNSNRSSLSAETILSRMNSELRAYPLPDFATVESSWIPVYSLEYWTQQCGIFYRNIPGDVLFYQSNYGHLGAFAKGANRPIRAIWNAAAPGATAGSTYTYDGRLWLGLGKGYTIPVPLPSAAPGVNQLAVRIPSNGSTTTVFGTDVRLGGSGNAGDITWTLYDAKGQKRQLRLLLTNSNGITLQFASGEAAFSPVLNSGVLPTDDYTVMVGVDTASAVGSTYRMRIFNSAGAMVTDWVANSASGPYGGLTLRTVTFHSELGGVGDEILVANTFVSSMKSLPSQRPANQKDFRAGYKTAKFMVGFSGNVWEHVKQYCSIYHLDMSYVAGKLTVAPRPRDVRKGASLSELTTTVRAREQARNVEVVNQQHTPTGQVPTVLWAADSVYQIAVGETQEFIVQTEHSILETTQPVCVSGINPYPYKMGVGQYVVTGSDGYIVSPTFWRDQGGKITTSTTDVEGEIKITIKGPDFSSPRAPYRISEGDAGRPALYVSGLGILSDPKTLKVGTGNSKAAKDVGVTIDSPFIGNTKLAYDAAVRAAKSFATPEVVVSIAEPLAFDEVSGLGTYPAGALVAQDGNVFRVDSVSQSPSRVSGSASQHNTIYQHNRRLAGAKISATNAYNAGKTIQQTNIKPLKG